MRPVKSPSAVARRALMVGACLLAACAPSFAPIDTGKPLTDRDLALSFSKNGNAEADEFSEQLVIRAQLEDEGSVYVKLTVTNLASADGRADLTVSVTTPDGRKLRFKERRDRGEWTFARDRFEAEVGDGRVELGVGRAHVVAKSEDFELDLELTTALPPLRPRGGIYDKGGRFYMTTVPIPRGAAKAHLTIFTEAEPEEPEETPESLGPDGPEPDGPAPVEPESPAPVEPEGPAPQSLQSLPIERAVLARQGPSMSYAEPVMELEVGEAPAEGLVLDLEGVGYAEHRAGNVAPYLLARRWYSVLDIGEERTVMLSVFEHAQPEGVARDPHAPPQPAQGFFFATGDEQMELFEPEIELKVKGWHNDAETTYPLPETIFFVDKARSAFEGVIVAGALSERKNDLEGLSKLERIVVKRFMKPWTFRFDRARFLFRKQNPGEPMREIRGQERLQVQQLN